MYTVLLDGPDPRFLGGSARDRNARIVRRAGAALCLPTDLYRYQSHAAMLVPSDVALTPSLFSDPTFNDAVRRVAPTRLDSASGASVVVGAAASLASLSSESCELATLASERVGSNTILHLGTPRARRQATHAALFATPKASDGWVSRHVTRPPSYLCTRAALIWGVSANAANFAALAVGLACAVIAAQPGYGAFVAAGILFQIAAVLDDVAGEIARATLTESELGARIDTLVNLVTYMACFFGTTIGWTREGSGTLAVTSTVLVGVAVAASLVRGARFVERQGNSATLVVVDRAVQRAARDTGRWPLRIAAGAFALLRRDMLAMTVLLVSLTGVRAAVPAMILLGTLIAQLVFGAYGQELADAARAERRRPRAAPAA